MRSHQNQSDPVGKGKAKQSDSDEILFQLNQLLQTLLIPISLPELSVVTPSLLLAVLESILERRFLPVEDLSRTSRSPNSKSRCLKVLLRILDETLDIETDRWSSKHVNLNRLLGSDLNEVLKLIRGLIQLSRRSNNPFLHNYQSQSNPINHDQTFRSTSNNRSKPQATSAQRQKTFKRAPLKAIDFQSEPIIEHSPALSPRTSLLSSSSSHSLRPTAARNFSSSAVSPIGLPLAQSSLKLYPRPSSAGLSSSSLSRSLGRQPQNHDDPQPAPSSQPPTLRDLLEPLQNQINASRRPQTPRTAHRVMVNKLRREATELDKDETKKPNHDTDTSMRRDQRNYVDEYTFERSRLEDLRGLSMITLDGIEADDPFVSIETRRALESMMYNTASFDQTRFAVAESSQSSALNSESYSSLSDNHQMYGDEDDNSIDEEEITEEELLPLSIQSPPTGQKPPTSSQSRFLDDLDASSDQRMEAKKSLGRLFDNPLIGHHQEGQLPVNESGTSCLNIFFGIADATPHGSEVESSTTTFLPHSQSSHSSNCPKVVLASQGATLDLICSDVAQFEQENSRSIAIEGWDWISIEHLSKESCNLKPRKLQENLDPKTRRLLRHKLELLKLLRKFQGNKDENHNQGDHQASRESIPQLEGNSSVRVRVSRNDSSDGGGGRGNLSSKKFISDGITLSRFQLLKIGEDQGNSSERVEDDESISNFLI
ncbi:expressed protein [Phakopsora pachyrhizi]|uniref:Expressed protein n=1 Tax=Phakopsora pachyrhizi TaxID=170000 RepID=A0AAV0ART6_PHAPC|nr:expressed protein [Phakopsora pachyrhizi]